MNQEIFCFILLVMCILYMLQYLIFNYLIIFVTSKIYYSFLLWLLLDACPIIVSRLTFPFLFIYYTISVKNHTI